MSFEEYDKLKKTIDYHMDRYYNQDAPEISDYEYDELMRQLKAAEKEHPEWVTPDSPTQKIGGTAKRKAGVKVTHNVPMLSIEDVFTHEDVEAWVDKVHSIYPDAKFSVEAKIDGLSLTLRYRKKDSEKMELYMAETRGDGLIGEDVFENALVIPDIKKTLCLPYEYLEIRGEVYMTHDDFERFNEIQEAEGKKTAANPRNLAAGTLRQLDCSITKERGLRMFVFNVQDGPEEMMKSQSEGLSKLEEKGVSIVYHKLCFSDEEVIGAIEKLGEMRSELPYDIDGAVVKLDNIAYRKDFPAGSKYSAGHIAYKYPPEERPVIMEEIEVTVGRTGKMGFIGHVKDAETGRPARLCGTNVSKVTLHNQDYINENKVGIGGIYLLKKSGDIIPKICGTVRVPEVIYKCADTCPVCGEKLIREEDTADIRCVNTFCPAQLSRTISYFTSIDCMNIMGLGETLINQLVAEGYLKDYSDIYALKNRRDELIEKGIIGKEKNTDKVLANIEESKKNEPERLLASLGIRNVGKATAKELLKNFDSVTAIAEADKEKLMNIQDIGQTTADCIYDFFRNEKNREIFDNLAAYGVNMKASEKDNTDRRFEGMTFVLTGTLPTLKRNEAQEIIEQFGGKCASSVSKKTTVVLAGEEAGSKLDKAKGLGIRIIDEIEFMSMIE